ncbi:MAG: ATP-binding cassette domain-containing protein [Planctomycetota bacterium]
MIFQQPLPFPFSIRKNLAMAQIERGGKDRHAIAEASEKALCAVGLWDEVKDRLDAPAQDLSGGQQQRLCLARALVLEPEILLLDEPCSSLDPMSGAVIEDLIAELRGRYTIVIVTHNLAQARRLADDLAVFWVVDGKGSLIESGPCDSVFDAPQHHLSRAYFSGLRG